MENNEMKELNEMEEILNSFDDKEQADLFRKQLDILKGKSKLEQVNIDRQKEVKLKNRKKNKLAKKARKIHLKRK